MRIAELSAASGVPLPTVKYYLREGLLSAGERSARSQVDYGPEHLARLRLIRSLVEVGRLSVTDTRRVLAAADDPQLSLEDVLDETQRAVANRPTSTHPTPTRPEPAWTEARALVRRAAEERGWQLEPDSPALDRACDAAVLLTMDVPELIPLLGIYADAAERLAEQEVAAVQTMGEQSEIARGVIVGTVLGEELLAALRLLAQRSITLALLQATDTHPPQAAKDEAEPGHTPRKTTGQDGSTGGPAAP